MRGGEGGRGKINSTWYNLYLIPKGHEVILTLPTESRNGSRIGRTERSSIELKLLEDAIVRIQEEI